MIAIERLVLELPEMEPGRAEALALALADLVAAAGIESTSRLSVTLPAGPVDDASILAAFAESLVRGRG